MIEKPQNSDKKVLSLGKTCASLKNEAGDCCEGKVRVYPLDLEGVKREMNEAAMGDDERLEYLKGAVHYWRARGLEVMDLRKMIDDCNDELDKELVEEQRQLERSRKRWEVEKMASQLELERWQLERDIMQEKQCCELNYKIELADLSARLASQRKVGTATNFVPMDCKEVLGAKPSEFTNFHFYLKKETPEVRTLIGDMDMNLKQQGYIKSGDNNSIRGVMGCISKNEMVRRVVWTGKLVELYALIIYLLDDVQVIGCTSGYNTRWRTTVACFVDKDWHEINVRSLSRSTSITDVDRARLLKCIPRM